MSEQKQFEAIVHGDVQGVGFRYWVRQQARRLNLKGYVRNRPDRTVEVVAQGPEPALDALLSMLHQGPSMASVRAVDVQRHSGSGTFRGFQIRF